MADQKGIKVGVFSDHCTMGDVPQAMRGKQIWYSPKLREYWILDDNHKYINKFYAAKFKQFVDIDAIVFTSDGVRNDMIEEANAVLVSNGTASTIASPVISPQPQEQALPSQFLPQQSQSFNGVQPYENRGGWQKQTGYPLAQMPVATSEAFPGNAGYYGTPYGTSYTAPQHDDFPPYGMQQQPETGAASSTMPELIDEGKKAELRPAQKAKDPSRHLFGFFLTTAILTAVAMIVILFGDSIANGVSTLLS